MLKTLLFCRGHVTATCVEYFVVRSLPFLLRTELKFYLPEGALDSVVSPTQLLIYYLYIASVAEERQPPVATWKVSMFFSWRGGCSLRTSWARSALAPHTNELFQISKLNESLKGAW